MEKILLSQLTELVRRVLAKLEVNAARATIVALEGELGAGKTTFVQTLVKELGVKETVQSPTYVLMKKYQIPKGDALTPGLSKASPFSTLIHIDAYRLENPGEFTALRPEEFLNNPKNLVFVEWPEKLGGALPPPDLTLKFSSQDAKEGERYIEVV